MVKHRPHFRYLVLVESGELRLMPAGPDMTDETLANRIQARELVRLPLPPRPAGTQVAGFCDAEPGRQPNCMIDGVFKYAFGPLLTAGLNEQSQPCGLMRKDARAFRLLRRAHRGHDLLVRGALRAHGCGSGGIRVAVSSVGAHEPVQRS
jgi:hypothetical protein